MGVLLREARELWILGEKSAREIAAIVGCGVRTLYTAAEKHRWTRGNQEGYLNGSRKLSSREIANMVGPARRRKGPVRWRCPSCLGVTRLPDLDAARSPRCPRCGRQAQKPPKC